MRLRIPSACTVVTTLTALLAAAPFCSFAQTPDASSEPISAAQVKLLLEEEQTGDAQLPLIHAQLEAKRATLPAWFPAAVWDEVERKVEAVHFADVAVPIYQKYMTSEQAEVEILLFKGPIGQQIATILEGRAAVAVKAGYTGSASDDQVAKTLQGDTAMQALFAKRLAELSPEEQTHVHDLIPGIRAVIPRIEDERSAAYKLKATAVAQQVLAEHKAEIAKAQAAAHH